jgi:hypothetical protein
VPYCGTQEKFDSSFPVPGGEDTVFTKKIISQNLKMHFNKKQIVFHIERGDLKSFIKWQITRGRGSYHIKKSWAVYSHFIN